MGEHQEADSVSMEHQLMIREQYRDVLAALEQFDHQDRELLSLVAEGSLAYRAQLVVAQGSFC